ncbi:hypothetical protein HQ590_05385 [bacterium]|nr:hypothetical protein [bacterium]
MTRRQMVALGWLALTAVMGASTALAAPRSAEIVSGPAWAIVPQGRFVQADSEVLRLRFAYGARGAEGWFKGGGGEDGSIVELYYKPTSATRNLVPRNGPWGGKKDALDFWEAEPAAQDGADHNAPQFSTPADAVLRDHRLRQSAGRLISECDLQLQTWRIRRTHIVYPWGDLTVHARLEHVAPARWNYLGHRFEFAVKPYRAVNGTNTFDWGGQYQADGEFYWAWSDLDDLREKGRHDEPFVYQEQIVEDLNKNTAISMFQRLDPYSGFMIEDRNGNDPDIVVINGDRSTRQSPFERIARPLGGRPYVETGIYTPFYSKQRHTYAGCCWFYATIPCCPPVYNRPFLWPGDLGPWEESFHVFLRPDLDPQDYLPLWRARSRDLPDQAPTQVHGAKARLDGVDRRYHLVPDPGAREISFGWQRASGAPRPIDYRTAFVLENCAAVESATIEGDPAVSLCVYAPADPDHEALLVLVGPQAAEPQPVIIRVRLRTAE